MRVEVPTSKSCYARIAMISAIADIAIPISNENDDIIAIREALSSSDGRVWVGSSGTAARFAIAYYASQESDVVIDGSEQMRKRPVSSIIEAVRRMGAEVDGERLPIRIKGHFWTNGEVEVDASQSSQTVSALMMAGMRSGLTIKTRGERNSWSYVELSADVMRKFGVDVEIDDNLVRVGKMGNSVRREVKAEKDWSSAVFWYGWCATRGEEIIINGLLSDSLQPDRAAIEIFGRLGVVTEETAEGIKVSLNRNIDVEDVFEVDCRNTPDLAMVLIPTLCRLGMKFRVTGLDTLDRKESRRGEALCCELCKAGYNVIWNGTSLCWNGVRIAKYGNPDVYGDHRIVMSLLILGMGTIDFQPLNKSYSNLTHLIKQLNI